MNLIDLTTIVAIDTSKIRLYLQACENKCFFKSIVVTCSACKCYQVYVFIELCKKSWF